MPKIIEMCKSQCTGCCACYNACQNECIKMIADSEGFLYPSIAKEKCNNCGLCDKACPTLNKPKNDYNKNPDVYAAWSLDDEIRLNSSSGGIFTELSKIILEKGGYVVGARYNKQHTVEHFIINNEQDLYILRKSKYVQSEIGITYRNVKKLMDDNHIVMFVGTPCQVAGLHSFLNKSYDNLFICDLVFHGANSPKVYLKYLSELEEIYKSKIKSVDFRDKRNGWKNFGTSIIFENEQEYFNDQHSDMFFKGFLKNFYLRPSCSQCQFKDFPRYSDITLADFWGVKFENDNLDFKKGVSLLMINSDKGENFLGKLKNKIYIDKKTIDLALPYNPCIIKSSSAKENYREMFFEGFNNGENVNEIVKGLI